MERLVFDGKGIVDAVARVQSMERQTGSGTS